MTMPRLSGSAHISGHALVPNYTPEKHGVGIVHIGAGAFFRAHLAAYTDAALQASGGDWRIRAVALRNARLVSELGAQDGRYTLIERSTTGTSARVIAAIGDVIGADPSATLIALCDPAIRIVTLTVTEHGYGIDRRTGGVDLGHPAICADLASPRQPTGVLGLIVAALRARRTSNVPAFTVLCCDNLPENGRLLCGAVVDFARRLDPELASWIATTVAFPCTMVDRITPASTAATMAEALRETGCVDLAAVETEDFSQWVIEDHFPTGRPDWQAMGAIFVHDVVPYEQMKLTMLNGAHSMLAYTGFLAGHRYVRDVMSDSHMNKLVHRHLTAAAAILPPSTNIDLTKYSAALAKRFTNPNIAHSTRQICSDGTEKLPQRLLAPAVKCMEQAKDIRPFAFAVAGWMRFALGLDDAQSEFTVTDPRAAEIRSALHGCPQSAPRVVAALHGLKGLFPARLLAAPEWAAAVTECLDTMLSRGMQQAIILESRR